MLIPSYGVIREEFNIPEALIAIPDAFFVLTSALFALIWGYYTDRINRSKVIMAGAFSWTIGMLLTALSYNYPMLIISRMASGAGLGCVLPVGYSIISDAVPPDERSGWFGTLAILSSISNGIGQGLSSFLGPLLTWRFPFLLLSSISIIIIFVLFFIKIPQRGSSEDELIDLTELNLEYSYKISKKDLKQILKKKTNRFLIIQGFFAIIPGTILVFFMTSMLSTHYFNELPVEIRLQTATIFAGMVGIGYLLGNALLSYIGDILYRRNKKYRAKFATICMLLTVPFTIMMLLAIQPISSEFVSKMNYPNSIPPEEIINYIFLTIVEVFKAYPNYIFYFIFAFIGSIFSTGWVSNKNAVMIDVNLPEHKGTASSFFSLSEQIGKGITLLISFTLISILGSIFNMMFIAVLFWIPAGVLWFFASNSVEEDMITKSKKLSERNQVSLIDFIFELEIQMDRAIQKIQDSKYYIQSDEKRFNQLLDDAIKIFIFTEREGEFRSITNIEKKAHIMKLRALLIKQETKKIYKKFKKERLTAREIEGFKEDLIQIRLRISEWEKSSFGKIQTYYEDAYLKTLEARLLRKNDLLKCLGKISQAIGIYESVKQLLNERIENINEKSDLTEEDSIVFNKEQELFNTCSKSLIATNKLKKEFESVFNQLSEKGILREDLIKISELTSEYRVDIYKIIVDTFGHDSRMKNAIMDILKKIDNIFDEYDFDIDFKVF